MDFLENNREQLIQRMEMATVKKIVDCLFAKSVLSCEEKDSILCQKVRQDASRKLTCSILEKGDEACGILVRSLEKIDFFLFKKLQGSRGLLDGISILANVEKIIFDNVKMNESTADKLAEGLKNLKKLNSLQLKELTNVGDGMISIVKSISLYLQELEEICLVNCCISVTAIEILVQNICNLPKLSALDLSNNFLGNGGKEAVCQLVESLNVLPKMKILMFPWVDEVNVCLVKLEELKRMPQLTKLGLKKWRTTNSDARILSTLFAKASLADLQHLDMAETCLTSEGWLTILEALTHLKKLTFLDFSQEQGFTPSARLVLALALLINQLVSLQKIDLTGWQFDTHELQEINKAKESHRNGLQVIVSSIKPLLDTTI